MTNECNACYRASTSPAWVANAVIRSRVDQPCQYHQLLADTPSEAPSTGLPQATSETATYVSQPLNRATPTRHAPLDYALRAGRTPQEIHIPPVHLIPVDHPALDRWSATMSTPTPVFDAMSPITSRP